MIDLFAQIAANFDARLSGPFHLRFILQPAVAAFFAVKDGRKDARAGNPPYAWTLLTAPEHRHDLMRDGWKSVGKVFLMVVAIDVVFQFFVLHAFHPVGALIVGFVLAIIPYALLRGLVARLASRLGASAAPRA